MGFSLPHEGVYTPSVSTLKYRQANRAKISEAAKKYRAENRDAIKTRTRAKLAADPQARQRRNRKREERRKLKGDDRRAYFKARQIRLAAEIKEKRRLWRIRDREKVRAYQSQPQVKLAMRLRQRLWDALGSRSTSGRMLRLLGCTVEQLMAHLEMQFEPGMTHENRGSVWHVDHVLPLSSFDLTDPAQVARACHFTNLQPLFAHDNLSKGAKVPRGTPHPLAFSFTLS